MKNYPRQMEVKANDFHVWKVLESTFLKCVRLLVKVLETQLDRNISSWWQQRLFSYACRLQILAWIKANVAVPTTENWIMNTGKHFNKHNLHIIYSNLIILSHCKLICVISSIQRSARRGEIFNLQFFMFHNDMEYNSPIRVSWRIREFTKWSMEKLTRSA